MFLWHSDGIIQSLRPAKKMQHTQLFLDIRTRADGRKVLHFPYMAISDIHWGSKYTRAKRLCQALEAFTCDRLDGVGDIIGGTEMMNKHTENFEFWHLQGLAKFLRKAGTGESNVTLLAGNHEEGLQRFLGREKNIFDMKIALRAEYTGTDGRRFLIVHGDEYDTATVKSWYAIGEFFLSIGYSADAIMRAIGLMEKYSLAAAFKRRVKKIINKQMGIGAAIEKSIDSSPYDGMIYGHTHMKGYHRSPGGKIIINDGCCTDHVQFAVQDKFGTWGLIEFHRKHMNVELEDGTSYNVQWKDHGLEHFGAMPPAEIHDEYTAKAERLLRVINRLWPSQSARASRA